MSRAPSSEPRGAIRALALGLMLVTAGAFGTMPVVAQDLPDCTDGPTFSDCLLPPWPEEVVRDTPSLFGPFQAGAWVTDTPGDVTASQLDIQAVGVAPISIEDAGQIRQSDGLLTAGKKNKAVKAGPAALVRIVLDRPLDAIEEGHAGIHLATDIDGARTNNAPAGVTRPNGPFAGMQDVYSLTYATTTEETRLLESDLARAWYKGKRPFAANWAAPNVLDLLVPAAAIGDGLKVVTYVSGPDGGYDTLSLGPSAVPVVGRVRLNPTCAEAAISGEPFAVRRLIENGQTLKNITAPASWQGGVAIPLDAEARAALEAWFAASDEDGDGRVLLPSTVSLFEDGLIVRQRPEVELALDDTTLQLALRLGLTRRGYGLIRTISPKSTDDVAVDAYLERAIDAMLQVTPAFRTTRKAGLLYGDSVGACVTQLISPPTPTIDAGDAPAGSEEAAASA